MPLSGKSDFCSIFQNKAFKPPALKKLSDSSTLTTKIPFSLNWFAWWNQLWFSSNKFKSLQTYKSSNLLVFATLPRIVMVGNVECLMIRNKDPNKQTKMPTSAPKVTVKTAVPINIPKSFQPWMWIKNATSCHSSRQYPA